MTTKSSNTLLELDESELSNFDFTAKELYLTLDKTPELTDEEIFEKFPEYNNNPEVLQQAKKKAMEFGGAELKKKDETTVSDVSLEGSDDSESETPSITVKKRQGVLENEDGSHSTHKMRTEQLDDGSWVSFPSLFQNDDGEWVDRSQEAEEDWMPVYQEASERGEVYEFGEDKEAAIKFGEGSWKEKKKKPSEGEIIESEKETSELDTDKFKNSLVNVEASGKKDYSLINPTSSAVGPYQFLYNTHKDILKSKFGVKSKKEFIGNKEAQEGLMNHMLEDKPGRYPFMAKRLQKDYSQYMPENMNLAQLTALEHYVGHGDLRKLFARVRDEKDFNAEDIYNVTPSGQNMSIGEYLERMTPDEEGQYIGMENPLDDPNLLAAGEGLPPGDYTTGDDAREFTKEEKKLIESFDSQKNWNFGEGGKDAIMEVMQSREPGDYLFYKSFNQGSGKYELRLEDKKTKKVIYSSDEKFDKESFLRSQAIEEQVAPLSELEAEYKSLFPKDYKGYKEHTEWHMRVMIDNYIEENPKYGINRTVGSAEEMLTSLKEKVTSGDRTSLTPFELNYGSDKEEITETDWFGRVKGKKTVHTLNDAKLEESRKTYSPLYSEIGDAFKTIHGVVKHTATDGSVSSKGVIVKDGGGQDKLDISWGIILDYESKGKDLNNPDKEMLNMYRSEIGGDYDPVKFVTHIATEKYNNMIDFQRTLVTSGIGEITEEFKDFPDDVSDKIKEYSANYITNQVSDYASNNDIHMITPETVLEEELAFNATIALYDNEIKEIYPKIYKKYQKEHLAQLSKMHESIAELQRSPELGKIGITTSSIPGPEHEDYIFRTVAGKYMTKDRYDDLPEKEVIDNYFVRKLADKFVEGKAEFQESFNVNLESAIENYNAENEIPFQSPDQMRLSVEEELERLNTIFGGFLDNDVKNEVIKSKFNGVSVDFEGEKLIFPESYHKAYNEIYTKADEETWKNYEGAPKNYVLEAFDRSLTGDILRYINDVQVHPDQNVRYSEIENFFIPAASIIVDPTLIIGGGLVRMGVGAGAKVATRIGAQSVTQILGRVRHGTQLLVQTGKYTKAEAQTIMMNTCRTQLQSYKASLAASQNVATSSIVIGAYEGSLATVNEMLTNTDIETADVINILNSTAHGLVVGAGVGYIGNRGLAYNRQIKALNYPKFLEITAQVGVGTGALVTEAGWFTAVTTGTQGIPEGVDKSQYLAQQFVHNLAFVGTLKASHLPMRLLKGPNPESFTKNLGAHEFKLSQGERIHLIQKENPNATVKEVLDLANTKGFDKKAFELIEKKINDYIKANDMKGLAEYVKDMPTDIYAKFNFSAANIETQITDVAEAVLTNAKMVETTDGMGNTMYLVTTYGKNGTAHSKESFKSLKEAENRVMMIHRGGEATRAQAILNHNLLDVNSTESIKKFEKEMEAAGLTTEDISRLKNLNPEDLLLIEYGTAKGKENLKLSKPAIEFLNNYYDKQQSAKAKEGKAEAETQKLEAIEALNLKGIELTDENIAKEIAERVEVRDKEKIKEAEALLKEKQEKGDKEETSTLMGMLEQHLGAKTGEPIRVTEENITKLRESAKTESQKEIIEDVIKSAKSLENIDGDVRVYTDNASFQKAMNAIDKGHVAEVTGGFRNTKTGDIYYNLSAMGKTTAAHETLHGLTETIRESSPEKYQSIEDKVYDLVKQTPEYAGVLDFINTKYQGKDVYRTEAQKKNEALVEFAARLSKGEYKLKENNKFVNNAKIGLNKLMEKLGLDIRFETNDKALSFINEIAGKVGKGEVIEKSELTDGKTAKGTGTKEAIQKRVNEQVEYHNKEGGSTFNQKGEVVEKGYSVSRYPERTKLVEGKKVSEKDIAEFTEKNKDILSKNPDSMVGTWYDAKTDKTYIDIIEVQKNKEKAIEVAKQNNQKAIFDLGTGKEIPTGGTGEALSEKQIARQNFNNKIATVREQYNNEISKIKGEAKEKDAAVKQIKSDLIDYIKGADHLNKGVKKSVLKNAVNVNTPEKLDRFIANVEEIAAKESLSLVQSDITSLGKQIKKKGKKGLYGDQINAITELINKDISEITDPGVLAELNNLFTDLNRRKQPLVNPSEIKKVSAKVEELLLNVEAQEPKIKNESQINTSLEKLTNKVKETNFDAISTEGAKDVISLARNLEALKKSLYKSEQGDKITKEQSEKIQKKIIEIENKLKGKTTEFNQERFNISQEILKNTDLSKLNKHEKKLIEDLKKSGFVDNIGHNDNLFVASINISNGFPPVNNIGKLLVASNNHKNSNKLSELITDRVDAHAGKKKWLGLFYDRLATTSEKLNRVLNNTPLALISERFRAERDVKNAGLIDKAIIAPITRAMSRYDRDVKETLKEWNNISNSATSKISNWFRSETTGRVLSIPFTKGLNPLYHKKQVSDNKVGVLLAQMQRNSGDGQNVLKTILENKNLINRYSTAEQVYLKNIYKNLPKKTVNGKEVIDIDKAIKGLTVREQKMIKKFREIMDNNLMPKQNFANGIRGIKFEGVTNYFPLILKPTARQSVISGNKAYENWANDIFINNNKGASDAGKERTSTDINAIDFNVNRVMLNRIKEVNRDFHFTQDVNMVRELLKDAKLNSSKDYNIYFEALSNRMQEATSVHLNTHSSKLNVELLSPVIKSLYNSKLFRVGRIATEAVTETFRVGVGASQRIQDLPNTFKSVADKASTNITNLGNMTNSLLVKDLKTENLNTALNTILELTDSQFIHKYSRHDIEFSKDVGGQNGLFNKVGNWALGAVDRNTLFMAYMPAFTKEFKSITGKEFSYSEIKNPAYQNKYAEAIKEAAAIGDRAAAQWKNVGVKGAGRATVQIPFGSYFGNVKATSEIAPLLTFMGNFGYLEVSMAQKSIRDLMAGESMETRAQGAKAFSSIMGAGIAYGMGTTAEFLLTDYLIKQQIILQSAEGDDKMGKYNEEQELMALNKEFNENWDKMFSTKGIKGQVVSNSAFLLKSKYSQASSVLAMAVGGVYDSWLKSDFAARELSKKEIQAEIESNKEWLNELELTDKDGLTVAQELLQGGLYVTPTTDVGRLAETLMPHIDHLVVKMEDASESYLKFRASGKVYDPETYAAEHEKFRDEIEAENLLMNALRLYFTFRGTAIPMDKMIAKYRTEMMDRYDQSPISFQEATQSDYDKSKWGKDSRFGKDDRWGKPE